MDEALEINPGKPNRRSGLTISRNIDLGHVLTIIAILGTMWAFSLKMENRLTRVEVQMEYLGRKVGP